MHALSGQQADAVGDIAASPAEVIALRYRQAANGDTWAALVQAVEDALTELAATDARAKAQARLISRGYVRARLDG